MSYRSKSKKGFTLIELLIVIAIIGILASVVLVSLSSARAKAKNAKALSAMQSVEKSVEVCIVGGGKINVPSTGGKICNDGSAEVYPNISDTGFSYHTTAYGSGQTGGVGGTQWFAFTAFAGTKYIVCAMNWKSTSWYKLTWDFTGSSGCAKSGF